MNRKIKKTILGFLDFIALMLALMVALYLRLDYWLLPSEKSWNLVFIFAPFLGILTLKLFNLYKRVYRFTDSSDLVILSKALLVYSITLYVFSLMLTFEGQSFPKSMVILNWLVSLIFLGSVRLLIKFLLMNIFTSNINKSDSNVLIYGAGSAGVLLAKNNVNFKEFKVVGFIDDDLNKQGNYIFGKKVYPETKIKELKKIFNVKEILIAIPSLSKQERNNLIRRISSYPIKIRNIPSIRGFINGDIKFDQIKNIAIEDLLGRSESVSVKDLLKKSVDQKNILVTGAGGSIGSEICIELAKLNVSRIILLENNEFALYKIEKKLSKYQNLIFSPILGSIESKETLKRIFEKYPVDSVFHAAAYKHVPIVENNIFAGIRNNIFGTLVCAKSSLEANVKNFILISTDKAVRPTNVMGATKRYAELVLQSLNQYSSENGLKTMFSMVRFGNVLNSSGSVIPLFDEQIRNGGPITVTDPNITRYFMTIKEAVQLVIQSSALTKGGEVFLLEMGNPVRIYDLATQMIKLSGLSIKDNNNPNGDIEIKFSGLRPGEKLYEELLIDGNAKKTSHRLIYKSEENFIRWEELELVTANLLEACEKFNLTKCKKILKETIIGYKPSENKESQT